MHHFDDLEQVQATLQRLAQRGPSLVKVLPRQPGTKEARYGHLLSGDLHAQSAERAASAAAAVKNDGDGGRIARLEKEVATLHEEVTDLKQQVTAFRKQFE